MIRSLHIENYVLIDSLDIDFPEGLAIITGQTGAGKSILLGALALLAGAKADASAIAAGAQNCVVEGDFLAPESLKRVVEGADLDWDGGNLLIRRVVNASGRSRAFVNDSPAGIQLLQEIGTALVDIHSQHQSLKLSDKQFQMDVLDSFAGCVAEVGRCTRTWNAMLSGTRELSALKERLSRLSEDREYNAERFRRLEEAALRDGELEELEAEQKQLANAGTIKEAFASSIALIEPEEGPGMESSLKELERTLSRISSFVPDVSALAERIRSVRIEISDIARSIAELDSGISLSRERLEQVEERMGLLYSLMQKHGCRSVAELVDAREKYRSALFDSESLEEEIAEKEKEISALRDTHLSLCKSIHAARAKAAPSLSERVEKSLRFLDLERAVFKVELSPSEPSATGEDVVTFRFSATGTPPADVSKCASGGEISRIMLCLKAIMARYAGMPTLVFDEIDTGVSGSAADKMGQMICGMGNDMQVLAITHLPQVAAKGSSHFVVEKSSSSSGTVSSMHRIEGEDRVKEIARLLSGETITAEAVANARALLGK